MPVATVDTTGSARLGDILRAHGDVVVATDQADFADVTLSIMAEAVWRAANDASGQLRFPAGSDAVALAQSKGA